MTPWLRALVRATGLLIVLGAAVLCGGSLSAHHALPTPSGATASSHAPLASLPASPSASPSFSASSLPFSASSPSSVSSSPPSPPSSPSAEPSWRRSRWPDRGREWPGRPPWWRTEAVPEEGDGRADPGDAHGSPESDPSSLSPQQAAPLTSGPADGSVSGTVPRTGTETGPMLRMLPLGSGLILIGLGLGLAFIALRLRRS
ncbi:hypothetical protein [Streptomyces thermoalcalitolerans]|uniref:Gram-positive cocci surface proteins LPxTG domain-containing protein n=1 Tax=Streptomyces thermoalcalitolerans TaxID=65605 RepID=A0ABN1NCX2_9ACTN